MKPQRLALRLGCRHCYNAPQKLSQVLTWCKLEHTGRKGVGPGDDSVTALAPILR
jgi:hypothetical protein